jgi:uncharacterized protein YndB with AHSA1/START domain
MACSRAAVSGEECFAISRDAQARGRGALAPFRDPGDTGRMFKWLFGRKDDSGAQAAAGGSPEVVVVSRKVAASPEAAFDAFIARFDTWWPKDRRIGGGPIKIEPRFGGRITEGADTVGSVLSYHRPEHIVIAWQVGPDRRLEPSEGSASRIDVRFVHVEGNGTEIIVVHRDFPRHGEGWQAYRAEMAGKTGWSAIVDAYAKAVGSAP